MVKINILINENILKKIELRGHTNYAEKGKDIVCSAVSILIYSAYLSFIKLPNVSADYIDDSNKVVLKVNEFNFDLLGELRGITLYLINGLKLIEEKYKKNISVKII